MKTKQIVKITKRVTTSAGYRYCQVVTSPHNGKIKPDWVLVNGVPEKHEEGAYYLEWTQNNQRIRLSVGVDAFVADEKRDRKEVELAAVKHGIKVLSSEPERKVKGDLIREAAKAFIADKRLVKRSPATIEKYARTLEYFQEYCRIQNLEHVTDLTRESLLRFYLFLEEEKDLAENSIKNSAIITQVFLNTYNIRLLKKGELPKATLEEPTIYEAEEIEKIFSVCTDQERLWYEFFLKTGERRGEVRHTEWEDIDLKHGVVRVTAKPHRKWKPKKNKEREIPIPSDLVERLKAYKAMVNPQPQDLVFASDRKAVFYNFWFVLQDIAKRAGYPESAEFTLHKFRRTFCTWHLRSGTDPRTLMLWAGHEKLETTLRYLKPARGEKMRVQVNKTFAEQMAVGA